MTLYLNADKGQFSFNKKDYLLRAAKRIGIDAIDVQQAEGEIEYLLNIQPCDIKRGSRWTGLWHIDVSLNSHFPQHYVNMDTVFVASRAGIVQYDKQIVLYQACDPALHRRYDIPQDYDYVLCGTGGATEGLYKRRGDVYRLLASKYKYHDFGNGHPPEVYIRNYNHAKVQIVQPSVGVNGQGMCAQRFFECLGIGPVLAADSPDLPHLGLIEGQDYMCFRDDKELIAKMDLLLKDKDLRDKIAFSGRQKALAMHTFEHRLVTILNTINEIAISSAL